MTLWVFLVPLSSTGIYDSLHIDNKAGHEFTESGTQQHTETRGEVKDQSLPQEQKGVFHCYLLFPPAECPTPIFTSHPGEGQPEHPLRKANGL